VRDDQTNAELNIVDRYLTGEDWRVRENANISFSHSSLLLHLSSTAIAKYMLSRVYPPEIADAHVNGDIHIHDLGNGMCGYCAGWSLQDLLVRGLGGIQGKVSSSPPRHFGTALLQIANFIGILQNEWAGAQAFNSIDTLLAPFVKNDGLEPGEVTQLIQEFVYNLNITSRWGSQTPFSNVSFDLYPLEDLKEQYVIIGGKTLDKTYEDYQSEMDDINSAFMRVMSKGDGIGNPFTFPIPTYNLTKDFVWGSDISDELFKMTSRYGLPYFQNFIGSSLNPRDIRSMCCHLRLDLKELRRNVTGGLFGSADKTGSVGVVTINMPRLGYLSKSEEEFMERLSSVMLLAKESLEIKRLVVSKNIQNGLLPFTKAYLNNLSNHFSTIGLVGMNEAALNIVNERIDEPEGRKLALKALKFMDGMVKEFQIETGNLYNLEATPAEGTSYRLARIDKQRYPEIITAGKDAPYYTNSTNLPVNTTLSLTEAIRHQEEFQEIYTGGTVFHVFLSGAWERVDRMKIPLMVGDVISGIDGCKNLVYNIAHTSRIPYFTLTPVYSICPSHGYLPGEHFNCPTCGTKSEVYSRVVGYYRPVGDWNVGKQEEFKDRKMYDKSSGE
jgi:anaerobic ribonucleoside-triphosphate reductase